MSNTQPKKREPAPKSGNGADSAMEAMLHNRLQRPQPSNPQPPAGEGAAKEQQGEAPA